MKTENYKNTFDNLIHDIKKNRCNFLVGAGISMLPPCSLPSGAELKNLALECLLGHQDLINYAKKIKNHTKYINIVPEVLFQRFYEALREELYPFFNVLNYANTNLAHKSLAYISNQYDLKIFTTNFDLLIEEYLNLKTKVIHLHGSLNDLSQMMIRINQVGRGIELNFKNILKKEIYEKSLYILGYSGNDKDIIDAINGCKVNKIYWFVRSNTDNFVLNNINRLNSTFECIVTECDLVDLFNSLSAYFSIGNIDPKSIRDFHDLQSKRLSHVTTLSRTINTADKFACYGKVFFELEEYITSSNVFIKAANKNFDKGIHNKYWFYAEAANCMRIIGDFEKGFEYAKKVIDDNNSKNYLNVLAASYNNYGLLLLEKENPEPKESVKYFKKAIKALDKFSKTIEGKKWTEGINIFKARMLNNLGLACENTDDFANSLEYYKSSLKIKQKIGDLIGISQTSANIAILFYKNKEYKKSYYWKKKVKNLSDKYQLYYQQAYLLRRIGSLNCQYGRKKIGLKLVQEALNIFKQLEGTNFDIKLSEETIQHYSK